MGERLLKSCQLHIEDADWIRLTFWQVVALYFEVLYFQWNIPTISLLKKTGWWLLAYQILPNILDNGTLWCIRGQYNGNLDKDKPGMDHLINCSKP